MMKMPLALLLILGALPSAFAAQDELVVIGRHLAHPTRVLAKFSTGAAPQSSQPTLSSLRLQVERQFALVPGLVVLDEPRNPAAARLASILSPEQQAAALERKIKALRESGLFEYVEADYAHTNLLAPNDERFVDGTLWGLRNLGQNGGLAGADINAVRAWDQTTGSSNIIVGVIDTGIRYTHRDLASQMWVNPAEIPNGADDDGNGFVDDIHGIDAILDSANPMDDDGHGTHVAGTIGAAANDGNPHVGVAWEVRLMGLKFIRSSSQGGFGLDSDAIQCIDYAVSKGVQVLNNSWGGGPFSQAVFDAIAAARTAGVLFVAAAGNDALDNDEFPHYPSSYDLDSVIAVAALDRRDQLADFSNYGQRTVHLGAPGVEIFSTTAGSDSEYDVYQGTSMAAPHVSGVAALILARYPGASLSELRERLLRTVVPVPALRGKTRTGGRVNAFNALNATADNVLEVSVDPPSGTALLAGSSNVIFATVTDLFGVTNATVTGTIVGSSNIVFSNDGQPPDMVTNDEVYTAVFIAPTTTTRLVIEIVAQAPGKTPGTNTVEYLISPPPPNDNFANAAKVPAVGAFADKILLATNKFASLEIREPRHAGVPTVAASLWWDWSPAASGQALIDTAGSSIDTVVGVYTGSVVSALRPVASTNDVRGKKQAYVTFPAVAGLTYRIAVAGADTTETGLIRLRVELGGEPDLVGPNVTVRIPVSGQTVTTNRLTIAGTSADPLPNASGVEKVFVQVNADLAKGAIGTTNWQTIERLEEGLNTIQVFAVDFSANKGPVTTLRITYAPMNPANDHFVNALPLAGTSGTNQVGTTNATREFKEPFHGGNEGGKSVWWYWIAPTDGVLFLSTSNSTFDTLLGLYTGTRVHDLTTIAGNDDAFDNVSYSKLTQAVVGNEVYRIAVDGFGGDSGLARLQYSFSPSRVYRLSVSATEGGTVTPGSGNYPSNSTVVLIATPAPFHEFIRWEGTYNSEDNPLSIVMRNDVTLLAVFQPKTFTDDFETGDFSRLPWSTSGNDPWFVQAEHKSLGQYAARSGNIGNNEQSRLRLTLETRAGRGSFDFKVSSEEAWDFLEFYLNGALVEKWSGEVGWLTFDFNVPAGRNTFEWRYTKDVNDADELDAAFLDNLRLPVFVQPGPTTPAVLTVRRRSDGAMEIRGRGQENQEYVIQSSSNFRSWQSISTNSAVNGRFEFIDTTAPTRPQLFYRAIVP